MGPDTPKKRRILTKLALLCGAGFFALVIGEVVARAFEPEPDTGPKLHVPLRDEPFLYGLNPEHPEVSSQGLRDREFEVPRPDGVGRILVLGDSVTYGVGVAVDETMPRHLARALEGSHEVVNAGVHGYSPFNQLHWYRARGRAFGAQTVVVVFCLNDVVDPHLHWRYSQGRVPSIPDAAVPNLEYHREHSIDVLEREAREYERRQATPWRQLRRSALVRRIWPLFESSVSLPDIRVDGRTFPGFLTGEDSIPITDPYDATAPEMRWLRGMYTELRDAVRADGARLITVTVPLAYQLDPDYPVLPQGLVARICDDLGVPCIRTLDALRRHPVDSVFLGRASGYDDVWHLTSFGLQVVAETVAAGL